MKASLISLFTFSICLLMFSSLPSCKPGKENTGEKFAIADTASINQVRLTDENGETLQLNREKGQWFADNKYLVRQDFVNTLLGTFHQMRIAYPVEENMRKGVMKLMNTKAKKIEVSFKGKNKTMYLSGGPHTGMGSYMYLHGDEIPYVVEIPFLEGNINSRFNVGIDEWRSHEAFNYKVHEVKSIRMEFPLDGYEGYTLHQISPDNFEINTLNAPSTREKVDRLKAMSFLNGFQNLNVEAFENDYPRIDSIKSSPPFLVIDLTDSANKRKSMSIFRMPNYRRSKTQYNAKGERLLYDLDRYFAVLNEDKDFAIIQRYVFEKIFVKYEDFK